MTIERLTATEASLASLLARGYADAEINAELALQPHELQDHLAEVYRKLGVRSRTELALLLGVAPLRRGGDSAPHAKGER